MSIITYKDYITASKLNLNTNEIKNSSYDLKRIVEKFNVTDDGYDDPAGKAPDTTKVHEQYNLFMYKFKGFHALYFEIQKLFRQLNNNQDEYYIQCWLNIYKKGQFIDWHEHYPPAHKTWHGFYCVDCEPSKTTYRLPGREDTIDVVSENNLLVMSKGDGDWHRTWPWEFEDRDRITIAFDIVPREHTDSRAKFWIPI